MMQGDDSDNNSVNLKIQIEDLEILDETDATVAPPQRPSQPVQSPSQPPLSAGVPYEPPQAPPQPPPLHPTLQPEQEQPATQPPPQAPQPTSYVEPNQGQPFDTFKDFSQKTTFSTQQREPTRNEFLSSSQDVSDLEIEGGAQQPASQSQPQTSQPPQDSQSQNPAQDSGNFFVADDVVDPQTSQSDTSSSDTPSAQDQGHNQGGQGTEDTLPARMGHAEQSRDLKTFVTDITSNTAGYGFEQGEDRDIRKKGRMGDKMVEMGLITEDQLNVALQEKKISGKMLGEILVELGFIDEDTLTTFLAEASGFELFDPKNTIVDGDALSLIEKSVALKYSILPISVNGNEVRVAMDDPYDVVALDTLRRYLPKGAQIKPMVATAKVLSEAIDAAYGFASSINAILKELEEEKSKNKAQKEVAALSEDEAFSHPIVRLVNALVFEAVKLGVSDLHFEPEENFIRLRYRLDGVLYTAQILHKQHWNGISQRLKIMSGLNIADKLTAQDGRFNLNVGGREADFRVSSLPTVHGENIVIRVLDKSESIMPLGGLGFSESNMAKIKMAQSKPEGIIIVTGPTGSGKTTSLYSMLNEINDVAVNIQTLEDPVEYSLPMIRQTHVREGVLEFADGIKALLRQDPDIIFIGEIRDSTTAEMALKAAMTGHQVYTTLHTNDSFGALPRLFDLGMKPGMVAGAIVSVFAQRLARRLCGNCKEEYVASEEECRYLGVDAAKSPTIFRARQGGCDACKGMGYKGRVATAEILLFDEEMDELVAKGESKADLKELAVKKGFKSMRDDGMLKVLEGITDFSALSKVVDINK